MPRPCGCDWDVRVFGHAYCRTTHWGTTITKHVICDCTTCTCDCHRKDG